LPRAPHGFSITFSQRQLNKAMAHAKYLQEAGLTMPLSPLGARRAGGLKDENRMSQSMRFGAGVSMAPLGSEADTWGVNVPDDAEVDENVSLEVQPRK
jgi:hypothetical protein